MRRRSSPHGAVRTERLDHRDMTRRSLYAASVTADALSGLLLTGVFNRWGVSQYGSVAAWVGALGTIAAVSVALWKAGEETRHRVEQEHRDQAERVSAWWDGTDHGPEMRERVYIINSSTELVYDVAIFVVFVQGGGPPSGENLMRLGIGTNKAFLSVLPPGHWSVTTSSGGSVPNRHLGVEVAFTDRHGTHWVRRSSGTLTENDQSAFAHYHVGRPVGYSNLIARAA